VDVESYKSRGLALRADVRQGRAAIFTFFFIWFRFGTVTTYKKNDRKQTKSEAKQVFHISIYKTRSFWQATASSSDWTLRIVFWFYIQYLKKDK